VADVGPQLDAVDAHTAAVVVGFVVGHVAPRDSFALAIFVHGSEIPALDVSVHPGASETTGERLASCRGVHERARPRHQVEQEPARHDVSASLRRTKHELVEPSFEAGSAPTRPSQPFG
jgi:hypothetical protein